MRVRLLFSRVQLLRLRFYAYELILFGVYARALQFLMRVSLFVQLLVSSDCFWTIFSDALCPEGMSFALK